MTLQGGSPFQPIPAQNPNRVLHRRLATATIREPTDNRPSAKQIARCWIDQNGGHERYFLENVRHGIRTHDDHEIWKAIAVDDPSWLSSDEYEDVIRVLQSELQA